MDLGAGDGRVVHAIATTFPECLVTGIEINAELSAAGQQLVADLPNAHVEQGDLFQADLAGVDLVFIFALPTMMRSLRHVLLPLQAGTLLLAFRYPLEIPNYPLHLIRESRFEIDGLDYEFFAYRRGDF
jgi:trans-aconitate methyltransferase